MSDIVEFLRARLDEDEQAARAAFSGQADPEEGWGAERSEWYRHTTITPHVGMIHESVQAEHIVRWNPARVLAEVEAKRRTLVRCEEEMLSGIPRLVHFATQTVWEMVKPYADHPEYDEAWRP